MTQEQTNKLCMLGVNLDEVMERFISNEALYFKCLHKLEDDHNFQGMKDAIVASDAKAAFDGAHALKGVVANLGLNNLYKEIAEITEVFRAGQLNFDPNNMERLKEAYNEAISVIKTL